MSDFIDLENDAHPYTKETSMNIETTKLETLADALFDLIRPKIKAMVDEIVEKECNGILDILPEEIDEYLVTNIEDHIADSLANNSSVISDITEQVKDELRNCITVEVDIQ